MAPRSIPAYPNPGSEPARRLGCECPVIDNGYGKGAYEKEGVPQFWVNGNCPLHGNLEVTDLEE